MAWWANVNGLGLSQGDLLPDCLLPIFVDSPIPRADGEASLAEAQPLRTNADPLAGMDFTRRVVIILRQVLDEVTLRTCQFFMGDGAKHTKRRYQRPGRVLRAWHTVG